MHRDTKLGLAMAILVIGFAAALCFPRQDLKGQTDLPLETASELDVAIGLTNAKVYAPQPEEPELLPVEEVLPVEPVPTPIDSAPLTTRSEPTPVDPESSRPNGLSERCLSCRARSNQRSSFTLGPTA